MIYLGFEFDALPNWDSLVTIKAPGNYKKPEAVAKYIEERKAAMAAGEATTELLTGFVSEIAVREGEEGDIALIREPADILKFFKVACDATQRGVCVVGYRIHRAMKMLALMNALNNSEPTQVAMFKWIDDAYNRFPGFIDPVSLMFGTTSIDIYNVAARFGLPVDVSDPVALVELAQFMLKNVDIGA